MEEEHCQQGIFCSAQKSSHSIHVVKQTQSLRVVRYLRVLNARDVCEVLLRRCLTKLDVGNRGIDSRVYGESRMLVGEISVKGKNWM